MHPLLPKILTRLALVPPVFGGIVILSAGTFNLWKLYAYLAVSMTAMVIMVLHFIKHDPAFLERRMKLKEKESQQKKIIGWAIPYYLFCIVFIGLDHRFSWSNAAWYWAVLGDVLFLLSYLMIYRVFKVNSYAARTVEVEKNQKVISTGPYSIVRHPMYSAMILMYISTPLAIGSFWAMIPFGLNMLVLILRLISEEKILTRDLEGYADYKQKVKYRLLPYLW